MTQNDIVCKNCGFVGLPEKKLPGHGLIEFILWFCYLVPGLIYSVWRRNSPYNICIACGSKEVVSITSPIGKALVSKINSEGIADSFSQQVISEKKNQQREVDQQKALIKKTTDKGDKLILKICLIGLPLLMIGGAAFQSSNGGINISSNKSETTSDTIVRSTGNMSNDKLLKLSEKERQNVFTIATKTDDTECNVTSTFYNGIGKKGSVKGYAFWSIRCDSGNSYMVEILPDAVGSSKILECAALKLVHAGTCFKKVTEW